MTKAPHHPTVRSTLSAFDSLDATVIPHVRFQLTRGEISDNGATPWTTTLGLGTPPQDLCFMLDTGTVNTWITASCCSSEACRAHASFDPGQSATFRPGDQAPSSVSFGPWGTMGVVIGSDLCHLERNGPGMVETISLNEPMNIYLSVSYCGHQFAQLDCDGGLAIPSVSCRQPSALLEQLASQGLIDHAVAAFFFDPVRGEGSCLMGAIDTRRFDPDTLNILPVQRLQGNLDYLWSVRLDGLRCVGGDNLAQDTPLVLDTGASRFKGGRAIIERLQNAMTDNGKRPTVVTSAEMLADYPDLEITLGGICYTLTPRQYFQHLGPARWELAVHYLEGLPDDLLLVGSVFLDTVYSIFHFGSGAAGEQAVALARPIRRSLSVQGIWKNEFGSTLEIGPVGADGCFRGTYRSDTGASGVYPVVGVADPAPVGENLAVSFSVSWRSVEGSEDPSWHWVSGFTGLLAEKDGVETLSTTYLLQRNATAEVADWMATAVYNSTFRRKGCG